MNLAYIVECYETFIVDEILELRRVGVDVTVMNAFRPPPEQDPVKEEMRAASLYFPDRYRGVTMANVRTFLRRPAAYVRMLFVLLARRQPLRMLALGGYYASKANHSGVDHIHATFGTRTATLAYVTATLAGTPFSFTTHAYDIFKPNPTLAWKARHAAFVRTISEFNRRFIAATYPDVDPAKVQVRYLGVDVERFRPIPRKPSGRLRILTVGRLADTKGHSLVIDACDRLVRSGHSITCRIVGAGECYEDLAANIFRRGLEGVIDLSGPLSHDAVRHVLGDTDLFVLACRQAKDSADQDGVPVALMEAMAMGVAVVSTAISGIPELIEDGVSGLLISPDDDEAVAAAVERLASDEALRNRLARGARLRIEHRFNLATNTQSLIALFRSATPRARASSSSPTSMAGTVPAGR